MASTLIADIQYYNLKADPAATGGINAGAQERLSAELSASTPKDLGVAITDFLKTGYTDPETGDPIYMKLHSADIREIA